MKNNSKFEDNKHVFDSYYKLSFFDIRPRSTCTYNQLCDDGKHGKMIEYCKWHQKFHPSVVIAGIQIIQVF
jgi:hypothetical protein